MARLFGTDGVRGVANTQLTCDLAFKLGQAAVAFQGKTILIGKDTRLSGDMLESAVAAGIMSMGGTALLAGIIPTPAIALLVRDLHCDGGIVISASHNPPEYNGIKLFDGARLQAARCRGGRDRGVRDRRAAPRPGARCRRATRWAWRMPVDPQAVRDSTWRTRCPTVADEGIDLARPEGGPGRGAWRVVRVERRGAAPVGRRGRGDQRGLRRHRHQRAVRIDPPGTPEATCVAETGADVGIAHDGDADRVMLVDALRQRDRRRRGGGRVRHRPEGARACWRATRRCPRSCATWGCRTRCATPASSSCRRRWATATCWRPCGRAVSS